MSEKLTSGLRGNFNRFLPDSGLVLEGGNISGTNLLDLQVNGASKFKVVNDGTLKTNTITTNDAFYLQIAQGGGIHHPGFWASGTAGALGGVNGAGFALGANYEFGWSGTNYDPVASVDLKLARDASDTLAQRRGVNAQTFRLYGTYTDSSNYERLSLSYTASNDYAITAEEAGTGSYRSLTFITYGNATTTFESDTIKLMSNGRFAWTSTSSSRGTADLFLTRKGAANLQLGAADAASPVAQTLSVQSVVAGTTNIAGANLTITGSQGTGTGDGGSLIFQVAPAGSSGSTQNALSTALTLTASGFAQFDQTKVYGANWGAGYHSGALTAITLELSSSVDNVLVKLTADDTNIMAQRNGVNAQTFRLYNTYTDASNYERGVFDWATTANVLRIGTEAAGTGTVRNIALVGGNVGIGTTTPNAKFEIIPSNTMPTTLSVGGLSIIETGNKTYPTTSNFTVTPGISQNIEVGGTQTINSTTPGGFNFIYGINNVLTKSNGNIQDIHAAYFNGFVQQFTWADQNTCRQYVGITDAFTYQGCDANGRTSSSLYAQTLTLSPASAQTQTISIAISQGMILSGQSTTGNTDNVNITTASGYAPILSFRNLFSGTHNYNITNYSAFETSSSWGTFGTTGTVNTTITNYYGLRLRSPSSATGLTVTNNFGVYQEWSLSKNYFAGNIGIGLTSPTARLAVANGTSATSTHIYGTYTDGSNYERGYLTSDTNGFTLGTEAAGTGTLRSLNFALGTVTASTPLNITQTWNNAAVTFTGIKFNATDTASAAASLLMDLQIGGASKFNIDREGRANIRGVDPQLRLGYLNESQFIINQGIVIASSSYLFAFSSSSIGVTTTNGDLFFRRKAAANLQLGGVDAASPVAQTLSVQSVVAGTTNTAGANLTITGSQGTGTGDGGSIIFQVAPAGSTGSTQNALSTALTISSNKYATFASAVQGITYLAIQPSGYTNALILYDTGAAPALALTAAGQIRWSNSGTNAGSTTDLIITRDAANILAQRNGVNAQQFNLYGSYTDASNYGRLEIISGYFGVTGAAAIRTTSAGTGTAGRLYLGVGGGNQWFFETNGNFLSNADNTYDIGASGANRPRSLYLASNLAVSGNTTLGGTLVANNTTGTSGYYLRTSGTGIYWSPVGASSTTQYLQVANANATFATKISPTTSGLLAHTGRATISTNLAVTGNTVLSGTLVANNTAGTSGYYLRTSGTGIYWSPVAAGSTTQYLQVANAVAIYQTKVIERAALANTNSSIATQTSRITLVNTNLTGTNTALRTLISDRLQVANAAVTYQTKVIERAALANTNASIATQASRITLVNTNLLATNTAIRALDAAKLSVANATTLLAAKATWTALTGTNTALRTLISDRLQVANAAATYQTKAIERAALANTNLRINLINTNLTGTNTALRTLISDRLQVANAAATYQTKSIERAALANTNASIATQATRINLINTNLTGTNTALRTLISDRLQVANAATIYQTKTIERAALANTNLRINLLNTNLTGTNTAIRALDAAKLSVANAVAIYVTKSNPTTSGLLAHTGRATISTNLAVTGNTTVGGSLTVTGDLTINGTTTTLNSTTLTVDDINITLGDTTSPSNATADGGGITLKGTTDKTFNWVSATAAWTSSENINLASGKSLYLNGTDFRATYAANSYVKSVLANTNSFIKSQLANTNLRVNLINTNLTGTNTALRTLISDRLQVANAVATYQTKTVERAALANTNASIATQASRITLVNTNLLGTNTAIRALDAQKLSVANATTLLAAKATWVALTGTNTALRTLISDRLQVANASATYQTKAVERAALANTNLRINLINTNLTGTNTALRTLVSDRYQVANVNTLLNAKATWTALTGTNTAIRALDAQKLQVANATTLFATKASWTALTGTNTALRTLISDRLQVANVVATYQTKAVERAALANTNASIATQTSRITLVNTNLLATNTAIRALDAAKLSVANAAVIYQTKTVERAALANTNLRINLINTNLTGTNTAIRALDAAKLSVANAVAIYQTKAIERAALANTNVSIAAQASRITLVNTNLTGTNTAIRALDAAKLSVANAAATYQTKVIERAALANTNASIATQATRITLVNTNLLGTNTAIRALDAAKLSVANATILLAAKATWVALTGTNTALRTLISDRLQVANAAATYQTKVIERAALANTNAYIAAQASRITLVNTNLTGTNTAIRALDAQKLSVANATSLLAAKSTWTALTGTNTALRTLISDRYQVANVNTLLATKATWSGLTGTNTALRTLISDRLQVANAAATYQTKTVERAALANTNASIATQASRITLVNTNLTGTNTAIRALDAAKLSVANAVAIYQTKTVERAALANTNLRINLINTNLTGTNTAIRALDAAKLSVANAATLYATKSNPTTSGLLAHTGRATISTNLAVSGNVSVTGISTFTGAATFNGAITLGDAATDLLTVNGRATIGQNLTVSGNTTLSGTINVAGANILQQTLTDGVTVTWDTSLGQIATLTLGGNRTMAAATNLKVGTYILHVVQDVTGSRTITWNAIFKWIAGVAPVLTTTANARDVFSFVSDGTNLYGSILPDMK